MMCFKNVCMSKHPYSIIVDSDFGVWEDCL